MSDLVSELAIQKQKIGVREICTTVILVALALFIGLSVASSMQAAGTLAVDGLQSQGL